MHVVFKVIRAHNIPIDLQLYYLYGFEIWVFDIRQIIENLPLRVLNRNTKFDLLVF